MNIGGRSPGKKKETQLTTHIQAINNAKKNENSQEFGNSDIDCEPSSWEYQRA
jgi:hypothetical protein